MAKKKQTKTLIRVKNSYLVAVILACVIILIIAVIVSSALEEPYNNLRKAASRSCEVTMEYMDQVQDNLLSGKIPSRDKHVIDFNLVDSGDPLTFFFILTIAVGNGEDGANICKTNSVFMDKFINQVKDAGLDPKDLIEDSYLNEKAQTLFLEIMANPSSEEKAEIIQYMKLKQ